MARPIQIRHSLRCAAGAGPLQGRPAAINAFAGERRRVIYVKIQPNRSKRKGSARDRMTGPSRIVASIVAIVLLGGAAAAFAIAWRPAIAAVEPPGPLAFDAALVKRGRDLAAIGNCNDCHTVRGAKNFAGGLPVPTPFGTIFSSNITPDAETGIGRWSEAAFRRAMRSGVNREGQHLYPTFPYDHFTNVSDEDDRALYAFLLTRRPVRAPARDNELSFPF